MHELLLISPTPLPASSTTHTLSVLAGLAAAQPTHYAAYHVVFKPNRLPASVTTATRGSLPSQSHGLTKVAGAPGDLFFLQLVGMLHEDPPQKQRGIQSGERSALSSASKPNVSKPSNPNADLQSPPIANSANETSKDADGNVTMHDSNPPESTTTTNPTDDTTTTTDDTATQTLPTQGAISTSSHPWTLEFRDYPDVPGRRPVCSRLMASIPVSGDTDPTTWIRAFGYELVGAHVRSGWRIVHGNVEILLVKMLHVPGEGEGMVLPRLKMGSTVRAGKGVHVERTGGLRDVGGGGSVGGGGAAGGGGADAAAKNDENSTVTAGDSTPTDPATDIASLDPLDASGSYVLMANVRVADDGFPDVLAQGAQELIALKERLRGVVELEVPDRAALDTRIRA